MSALCLSLLGPFDCRDATGANVALPTRKAQAIIAYLAMNPGKDQSRETLAALVWDDKAEEQARANLRKTLSRMRHAMPDSAAACLVANSSHVALRPDAVEVDATQFERLAAAGTPETLEQAAELYQGVLLAGFSGCGEVYDEWLSVERRRLDELAQSVLGRLLDHFVVIGAVDRAIQVALRLLALDPLQEGVHRTLMRLYVYQDRIGAAHQQYEDCRDILARELDVEPASETESLRAEVLRLLPPGSKRETDDLPERAALARTTAEGRARRRIGLSRRPSIAVLPFAVSGDDGAYAHLGEGMAEDIITEFGRFPDLDVISPTTAFAYRASNIPAAGVGLELGTRYVLEGSLRPQGDGLRITARLVECRTDWQLWAERYDCAFAEVFRVQDELVRGIVGPLAGQIETAELEHAKRRRPEDWEAYDFWLRGWHALRRVDTAAIVEARGYFESAVEKDPEFARAYVGLAAANLSEWYCYSWNHWVFGREEGLRHARTAVELDNNDHRAHCMLGMAELFQGDYEAARLRLLKALRLNPNDADVLAHVSFAMALIGEHDLAVETGRNALRLAPYHPEWYEAFVGIALFAARLYDEAIETMAAAPEATCVTPAFIAASYAHSERSGEVTSHRETVYRHYRQQLARGDFSADTSPVDWLLGLDPFQRAEDAAHYEAGLRKAGFE